MTQCARPLSSSIYFPTFTGLALGAVYFLNGEKWKK